MKTSIIAPFAFFSLSGAIQVQSEASDEAVKLLNQMEGYTKGKEFDDEFTQALKDKINFMVANYIALNEISVDSGDAGDEFGNGNTVVEGDVEVAYHGHNPSEDDADSMLPGIDADAIIDSILNPEPTPETPSTPSTPFHEQSFVLVAENWSNGVKHGAPAICPYENGEIPCFLDGETKMAYFSCDGYAHSMDCSDARCYVIAKAEYDDSNSYTPGYSYTAKKQDMWPAICYTDDEYPTYGWTAPGTGCHYSGPGFEKPLESMKYSMIQPTTMLPATYASTFDYYYNQYCSTCE